MNFFDYLPGTGYVCAHRGARSIAPENTLLALEESRRCGADLWEADVQITADGVPVIFHDDTLGRTTDIAEKNEFQEREPWSVSDFSFEELQSLNCGSWFVERDPYGTIASGEVDAARIETATRQRIVSLSEVLVYCRQHQFPFNLEIKDQHGRVSTDVVVATVLNQIRQTETDDLILVSSFNHDYLRQMKTCAPDILTAALVEGRHPENLIGYLQGLGVAAYHPDWQIADASLIRQLADVGIRTNLWTVNDVKIARNFMLAGAGFICTDWPQRLHSA